MNLSLRVAKLLTFWPCLCIEVQNTWSLAISTRHASTHLHASPYPKLSQCRHVKFICHWELNTWSSCFYQYAVIFKRVTRWFTALQYCFSNFSFSASSVSVQVGFVTKRYTKWNDFSKSICKQPAELLHQVKLCFCATIQMQSLKRRIKMQTFDSICSKVTDYSQLLTFPKP